MPGIIATAKGAVNRWGTGPAKGATAQQFELACWRGGALASVICLAYDEIHRMPAWLLAGLPVLVIVLALRPRYFLVAVPIIIVLAILKPRVGKRR